MVAVAIGIAVAAPYLGAAFLTAIGTTTATALATSLATAAAATFLAVGAGLAFRALGVGAPKPSSAVGPPSVFRQSVAHSFIVYGKRRVGGLMAFFHSRQSGDDHFRYFVIVCAGHQVNGLTKWFLNDDEVTVDGSNMVTTGPYANAAWLWFVRGTSTQTANATFVSETSGKWTTDHRGRGLAMIYAKFQMTEAVVQAGMPNITAEIEGKDDIYDPRTETSGYTNNAALVFYDWMALPREEGGFGAYADEIPDDDYISAQANVCDESVNSKPRYAIDAVITTGAPPAEIRDVMIVNMAGTYTYSGGKHLMRVGYWVPVSETLLEDDFSGPLQVSPFLTGDVAATEVQGTYVSPDDGYQAMAFATQSIAATDVRQMDLDLAMTTNPDQAARVAAIMLKRAQCEKTVVAPGNINWLRTAALDTVQLDTSRYSLSNYAFTVTNWGMSSDFGVVLNLREENEDIYDPPTEVVPPTVPDIDVPDPLGGPVDPNDFLTGEAPTINNGIFTGTTDVQGGQLKFPATQVPSADANTLDDYEEGTFTPTLRFGGASTGITYTNQLGRYTKIGNRVFFEIRIILTNKGSSTGNATIAGLPFTSNASLPAAVGAVRAVTMTTVAMPVYSIGASGTVVNLEDFTGSTLANLTDADFTNTSQVHLTGSYSV